MTQDLGLNSDHFLQHFLLGVDELMLDTTKDGVGPDGECSILLPDYFVNLINLDVVARVEYNEKVDGMIGEALLTPRYRTVESELAHEDLCYEITVVKKKLEPVERDSICSQPCD